ncbi:hypothetical protein T12_6060 [Trichinella patagoniensis]|uniref:Uncharacterized protein n=1 Tax=Trichinella patagoniensis TaxID=990121 RepID=A0A0V0ZDF6_9BILA|nr:hypothetical protein T12_6060 [Trichinella patagoniensis]
MIAKQREKERETSPQEVLATHRKGRRSCSVGAWGSVRGRPQCDLSPRLLVARSDKHVIRLLERSTRIAVTNGTILKPRCTHQPLRKTLTPPTELLVFTYEHHNKRKASDFALSNVVHGKQQTKEDNVNVQEILEDVANGTDKIACANYLPETDAIPADTARVNSGRLIFIGDETRSENMLSPSHFLMGQINLTRQFQRGIRSANIENYGK